MSLPLALTASACSNLGCLSFGEVTNSWPGCLIHNKLSINIECINGWKGRGGSSESGALLSSCPILSFSLNDNLRFSSKPRARKTGMSCSHLPVGYSRACPMEMGTKPVCYNSVIWGSSNFPLKQSSTTKAVCARDCPCTETVFGVSPSLENNRILAHSHTMA